MFYTEIQAQTMECPFRTDKNNIVYCTGSMCIAWEWAPEFTYEHEPVGTPQPDWKGYCQEVAS